MNRRWTTLRVLTTTLAVVVIAAGVAKVFAKNMHWSWGGNNQSWQFGWAINGVKGSGQEVTQTREIADFTALDVGGMYEVELVAGQSPSLVISGDDNIVPLVSTTVHNGKLTITSEGRIRPKLALKLNITVPNIERVHSSGASELQIRQVNNDKLFIETSGAGSVVLEAETKHLTIETSGAGSIKARGVAETFVVETSGAGDVQAKDLRASNVKVSVSGAGDVEVFARQTLDVHVSGASDVSYYGNPKTVNKHVSGAGDVRKRD